MGRRVCALCSNENIYILFVVHLLNLKYIVFASRKCYHAFIIYAYYVYSKLNSIACGYA